MEAIVYAAQKPLRATYKVTPAAALVTDHARTCGDLPADPFHSRVEPMEGCGVLVPIGTHAAVGGPHDGPPETCCALPWLPARIRPCVWSPTCSVLNSPAWRST